MERKPGMDIRSMQYFVEICQSMSFSAAAKKLFITQQALSKAVRRMEEELQLPLLHRYANNIELTPFGTEFLAECQTVITQYEASMTRIARLSDAARKNLTVAFGSGSLSALSPKTLVDFRTKHPEITLHALELPDLQAEQTVDSGEAEVGFTVGVPLREERFERRLMFRSQLCLLVNASHPLAARETVSIADLRGIPLIGRDDNFHCSRLVEEKCRRLGFTPQYFLRSTNPFTDQFLLAGNYCAALGLVHLDGPNLAKRNLRAVRFEESDMNWDIYLITIVGHQLSPAARAFVDYYLDIAEKGIPTYR